MALGLACGGIEGNKAASKRRRDHLDKRVWPKNNIML